MKHRSIGPEQIAADQDDTGREMAEWTAIEEEIEAWELDTQDLNDLGTHGYDFSLAGDR